MIWEGSYRFGLFHVFLLFLLGLFRLHAELFGRHLELEDGVHDSWFGRRWLRFFVTHCVLDLWYEVD